MKKFLNHISLQEAVSMVKAWRWDRSFVSIGALILGMVLVCTGCGTKNLKSDSTERSHAVGQTIPDKMNPLKSEPKDTTERTQPKQAASTSQEVGKRLGQAKEQLSRTFGSLRETLHGEPKEFEDKAAPLLRALPQQAKEYWQALATKHHLERGQDPKLTEQEEEGIKQSTSRLEDAVELAAKGLNHFRDGVGTIFGGFFRDRVGLYLEETQNAIFGGWDSENWPVLDLLRNKQ